MDGVHCSPQRTYMVWVQSGHKPGHTPAFQVLPQLCLGQRGAVQPAFLCGFSTLFFGGLSQLVPADTVPVTIVRLGGNRLRGLVPSLASPLLSVCDEMLVGNVTSDLVFAVKGCNWCKCVKIRLRGKEMGSQDSSCSTAALGYPGYTLGPC